MATKILQLHKGKILALASVPALSFTAHAAAESSQGSKVRISELPIYSNPEDKNKYEIEEEKITWLRQNVSKAREAVWEYKDSMQETIDLVSDTYNIGKAHTTDLLSRLQDKQMLTDVIIISGGGLAGAVLGFRGGIFRKVLLAGVGATTAASLLYPNKAVDLSSEAWNKVVQQTQSFLDGPSDSSKKDKEAQKSSEEGS